MYQVIKDMIEKMGYTVSGQIKISFPNSSLVESTLFFLPPRSTSYSGTLLQVKLVRVTKRVHEAYFAQIYLTKACILCMFLIIDL